MYVVPDLSVGGAERHVTTLMPNMDRARFETAVLCVGEEGELFSDLIHAGTQATALHRRKRQALRAIVDLVREMRSFAPDVVITRGYSAETLGRIAAAIARIPHSVVWVHNHGDGPGRGVVRRIADRVLDTVTSAYFGVAQAQAQYMVDGLNCPADKIHIIYNGVDPEEFDPTDDRRAVAEFGIDSSDKVVGIVAALRPEKDHATFLRAARLTVDRVPAAKFLIVGEGPMRADIERHVQLLGLADCVTLTGCLSDVPNVLRAMDVFVLSSYTVECFPMALLEAMAAGRPAVCTAVGGIPEMVEDGLTGFLVPPRQPSALADRLVGLLTDDEAASRMGRAARTRVEQRFNLRASTLAAERALAEVVARPAAPSASSRAPRTDEPRPRRQPMFRQRNTLGDHA
jgi:glycosyltransferase involved in cell wall biosynthesis